MYMQLVGLSLLELVVLEIASTYKTMYFKKIQLVASPVFSPGFCLGESQGPLCWEIGALQEHKGDKVTLNGLLHEVWFNNDAYTNLHHLCGNSKINGNKI